MGETDEHSAQIVGLFRHNIIWVYIVHCLALCFSSIRPWKTSYKLKTQVRRQSTLRLSENGEHGAYTQRSSAQRMNKQAGAPIKTNSPSRAIFSFGNFCQPIDKFKSTTFVSIIAKIRRQTLCKKCGRGSQKKK